MQFVSAKGWPDAAPLCEVARTPRLGVAIMHDLTIVFDLDGTLIDTAPDLFRAADFVLAEAGLAPAPPGLLRPLIGFGARVMIKAAFADQGRPLPEAELEAVYARYLAHYADNIAAESRPYPGLVAALDTLAEEGALLAVCTNKSEALARRLLATLHLLPRFAALAGWDTFDVFKPHPAHLTRTVVLAGGNPRKAILVGDSDTDIKTARAAGVPVIGVPFGYTDVPVHKLGPDAVIDHYRDLEAAIHRVRPR
jgi:phosphoglycolate phosphatase